MLLKLLFNVTLHDHTRVWKYRKQSQKRDRIFFLTHRTAKILLPQISTSVQPSEMPFTARGLGVMRFLKKLSCGCENNIQIRARTG
jgi:hypothetical protein